MYLNRKNIDIEGRVSVKDDPKMVSSGLEGCLTKYFLDRKQSRIYKNKHDSKK